LANLGNQQLFCGKLGQGLCPRHINGNGNTILAGGIMKHILVFLTIFTICFGLLPVASFADSPPATLTIDGVPAGTFPSVQAAVDAVEANAGTNFVIEIAAGTVTEELNIKQQANKNVVIRPQPGATVTFKNTINIDGSGDIDSPETLLIEGLHFDLTGTTVANCIFIPSFSPVHNYAHNVTINGCTFKGEFNSVAQVAVRVEANAGARNLAIMNCTATNLHSLGQLYAVSGYAFIQNCIVSNGSEGGVNYYGTADLIVDSCKFDVQTYAVRSGQSSGQPSSGSVTINNSVLNSNSATDGTVVLRVESTRNINIIHSNITNAAAGPSLQALNSSGFDIDIVESNMVGEIPSSDSNTITIIDDPNVPNGPVNITGNGGNTAYIFLIVFLSVAVVILLLILLAILGI